MTLAYHKARKIIKRHVNANENDVLITSGDGDKTRIAEGIVNVLAGVTQS